MGSGRRMENGELAMNFNLEELQAEAARLAPQKVNFGICWLLLRREIVRCKAGVKRSRNGTSPANAKSGASIYHAANAEIFKSLTNKATPTEKKKNKARRMWKTGIGLVKTVRRMSAQSQSESDPAEFPNSPDVMGVVRKRRISSL